jgi:hypothetical protein
MPMPLAAWPVVLSGIPLKIVKSPNVGGSNAVDDPAAEVGLSGAFMTQDQATTFGRRDVVVQLNDFRRGSGFLRRRTEADEGGLAWVENGFFHTGQGITHSGRLQSNVIALAASNPAILDSRSFAGHRWCITNGGNVVRFAAEDPTTAPVYDPPLNNFLNPTTSLHAGYLCTAIEVFQKASGEPALYVAAYNPSVPGTILYEYALSNAGNHWTTSATYFTFKIEKLVAPVWWEGADGVPAQRMVAAIVEPIATGQVANVVRHVIAGSDPLVQANWVTPTKLGTDMSVTGLLAFPEFFYALSPKGIHTVNAFRAMNVTPYWRTGSSYADGGVSTIYYHGIVAARGYGLDYYDATQNYRRQDETFEIGPGLGAQDGTPIRGRITALCQYEGALLMALYNPESHTTYIGRAYPRERLGIQTTNPFVHYWAEQVLGASAGPVGHQVTHMIVTSPGVAGTPVLGARAVYLWLFCTDEPYNAASQWDLNYAALPVGSGPLSLQVSQGTFAYNADMRAYLTHPNWSDDLAVKYVRRFDVLSQLNGGQVSVYTRADGPLTSVGVIGSGTSDWRLAGTSLGGDLTRIIPPQTVSGRSIPMLLTSHTDTPTLAPVVESVSPRARVVRETFETVTLYVVLDQSETANGAADLRDPSDLFDTVTALQNGGPVAYTDEEGADHTVYVEQGCAFEKLHIGDGQFQTVLKVDLSLVG